MTHRKLLVTGGCGFIGTNFIRHVLSIHNNVSILNFDALTYAGNPSNLDDLQTSIENRYSMIRGNICDEDLLENIFQENDFDGVIHFAAESHVDRSIIGPKAFIETNIQGTFNLLEQSVKLWRRKGERDFRFVHVSTDEVYGSLGSDGYFSEKTAYDPSSPYSASKAASDHLVKAYHRTYGLPTMVTNCSNNFGPYQFPEKLIPLMIMNIIDEKPLPVYGDGQNVRDWIYVMDHCQAVLEVFEKGRDGETYNIGGNSEKKNIDIVNQLCMIIDRKLERTGKHDSRRLIRFVGDRPGHDRRYAIDAAKIKSEIGFIPCYSFDNALEITVAWFMDNQKWVESVRSGEYRVWIEQNYSARKGLCK